MRRGRRAGCGGVRRARSGRRPRSPRPWRSAASGVARPARWRDLAASYATISLQPPGRANMPLASPAAWRRRCRRVGLGAAARSCASRSSGCCAMSSVSRAEEQDGVAVARRAGRGRFGSSPLIVEAGQAGGRPSPGANRDRRSSIHVCERDSTVEPCRHKLKRPRLLRDSRPARTSRSASSRRPGAARCVDALRWMSPEIAATHVRSASPAGRALSRRRRFRSAGCTENTISRAAAGRRKLIAEPCHLPGVAGCLSAPGRRRAVSSRIARTSGARSNAESISGPMPPWPLASRSRSTASPARARGAPRRPAR